MEKTLTAEVDKTNDLSGQLSDATNKLNNQLVDLREAEAKLFEAEERIQTVRLTDYNGPVLTSVRWTATS